MRFRARRVGYAEVMSTIAVFLALGGGAWALAKDSVTEREIQNGSVRSVELTNDDVRGADIEAGAVGASDVADGSLGAAEIADGSVGGAEIDEDSLSFQALPGAGVLAAQIRDIGGDGDLTFGPLSGRAVASTVIEEVAEGLPPPTTFGNLAVFLPDVLAAGESRTFTVVVEARAGGQILDSDISCTIGAGQDHCFDGATDGSGALLAAVRVESTGAGLSATDSAFVGLAAESGLD